MRLIAAMLILAAVFALASGLAAFGMFAAGWSVRALWRCGGDRLKGWQDGAQRRANW